MFASKKQKTIKLRSHNKFDSLDTALAVVNKEYFVETFSKESCEQGHELLQKWVDVYQDGNYELFTPSYILAYHLSLCKKREKMALKKKVKAAANPGPKIVTQPVRMSVKKLLVFDLNKVLIYREKFTSNFILRPHCHEFIESMSSFFVLAVWTSMKAKNKKNIIASLFPPAKPTGEPYLLFTWYQSMCSKRENNHNSIGGTIASTVATDEEVGDALFLKDLSKVWEQFPQFGIYNTVLMDDSKDKCVKNAAHNCVHPEPFWPSNLETDEELKVGGPLWQYLYHLASADIASTLRHETWKQYEFVRK